MANIKVVLDYPLFDGMAITFSAPCECNAVSGLTVSGSGDSKTFTFRDAHGNDLTGIGNLFSAGAYVKAILDTVNGHAYIQNADTNSYIESTKATVPKSASGTMIDIKDSIAAPLRGLTLYGKTTQDGTPTPEAPVELVSAGKGGSIVVNVTGKNLFGGDALADIIVKKSSATKDTEAGTVNFAASAIGSKDLLKNCFKPNTRYTIILYGRNTSTSSKAANLRLSYTDGSYDNLDFPTAGEVTYCVHVTDSGKTPKLLYGANRANRTILYYDKCGVFEGVLTKADFIPYVGGTVAAQTPNGLNGIGEVKDEIDFARGVYVQKVGRIDSYAGEEIPGAFMSTTGELSTGATVLYVLAEPIETPLSAEELSAYATLHTDKPETTIYNDAAADMEVSYFNKNAAVLMNCGQPHDSGKILAIDENGCVAKAVGTPVMVGITAGTTDITAGSSALATGTYYDVYE